MEISETGPKQICPYCQFLLPSFGSFCPNCGKPLNQKSISLSVTRQIMIYLVSFFLPPMGLGWGIKYLRQEDPAVKKVGLAATLLTAISIALTVWLSLSFINSLSQTFQSQTEF